MGIRIHNYLDDWLILTRSEAVLTSHKTLLLSYLGCLGLRVNFAKSILSPSQTSFIPGHSYRLQGRYRPSTHSVGSASHATYPVSLGVGVISAARSSPLADPLETGSSLSSEWYAMASTARVMDPTCVAAQREPFGLPERVLNTMAEARAPSTRCLYALTWSVFSTWCQDRDLDPVTSDVSVVLSFLQEMLDKKRSTPLLLADRWAEIGG